MQNSPLREQPREQRAGVIPLKHESSLLDWLQANGRLISRDQQQEAEVSADEEDDVAGLIDSDDVGDFYDDDDEVIIDDEE
ncbi:MAG TPA: DUF3134 domain-containing protein [Leptolyngbyaceae cyanobacterium]